MSERINPPTRLSSHEIAQWARQERSLLLAAYLHSAAGFVAASIRSFVRAGVRAAHRFAADRKLRHDMRAFQKFDDRMLADIGVCRGEIEYIVRYGRSASTRLIAAANSRRKAHPAATARTGINWA